ncbi:hypothetical protein C7M84_012687 [Penaeus vannamei]|uniref:Uncharacterized protein n=1 Tax=Penaeus vannamei TaxID=6689 RepID=A0A423U9Y6_PENVA|nr:hypothetical protein C7M84_012687 [Penaeus vannamei]
MHLMKPSPFLLYQSPSLPIPISPILHPPSPPPSFPTPLPPLTFLFFLSRVPYPLHPHSVPPPLSLRQPSSSATSCLSSPSSLLPHGLPALPLDYRSLGAHPPFPPSPLTSPSPTLFPPLSPSLSPLAPPLPRLRLPTPLLTPLSPPHPTPRGRGAFPAPRGPCARFALSRAVSALCRWSGRCLAPHPPDVSASLVTPAPPHETSSRLPRRSAPPTATLGLRLLLVRGSRVDPAPPPWSPVRARVPRRVPVARSCGFPRLPRRATAWGGCGSPPPVPTQFLLLFPPPPLALRPRPALASSALPTPLSSSFSNPPSAAEWPASPLVPPHAGSALVSRLPPVPPTRALPPLSLIKRRVESLHVVLTSLTKPRPLIKLRPSSSSAPQAPPSSSRPPHQAPPPSSSSSPAPSSKLRLPLKARPLIKLRPLIRHHNICNSTTGSHVCS